MQMVFQDPLSSLNPRHTVRTALATPLRLHRLCPRDEVEERVVRMLRRVGLAASTADRYPHQLSGGQVQRAAIGRALLLSPDLLLADEAVSKLDVSVRAQVLNLLKDIQEERRLGLVSSRHGRSGRRAARRHTHIPLRRAGARWRVPRVLVS